LIIWVLAILWLATYLGIYGVCYEHENCAPSWFTHGQPSQYSIVAYAVIFGNLYIFYLGFASNGIQSEEIFYDDKKQKAKFIKLSEFNDLVESMHQEKPSVVVKVRCFHYEVDSEGDQTNVASYEGEEEFQYEASEDLSPYLPVAITNRLGIVKLSLTVQLANDEAKVALDKFMSLVRENNQNRDAQITLSINAKVGELYLNSDVSKPQQFVTDITKVYYVYEGQMPFYYSVGYAWLLLLIALAPLYTFFIKSRSERIKYTVMKRLFLGAQDSNVVFQV